MYGCSQAGLPRTHGLGGIAAPRDIRPSKHRGWAYLRGQGRFPPENGAPAQASISLPQPERHWAQPRPTPSRNCSGWAEAATKPTSRGPRRGTASNRTMPKRCTMELHSQPISLSQRCSGYGKHRYTHIPNNRKQEKARGEGRTTSTRRNPNAWAWHPTETALPCTVTFAAI